MLFRIFPDTRMFGGSELAVFLKIKHIYLLTKPPAKRNLAMQWVAKSYDRKGRFRLVS